MQLEKKLVDMIQRDFEAGFMFMDTRDIPGLWNNDLITPYQGKVGDNFTLSVPDESSKRLTIRTDRISAFDIVRKTPIPHKGLVLTALNDYWTKKFPEFLDQSVIAGIDPNVTYAHECKVELVEVVLRRHFTGSGWRDYNKLPFKADASGLIIEENGKTVPDDSKPLSSTHNRFYQQYGIEITPDMFEGGEIKEGGRFKEIIVTPTTKAPQGEHDEGITYDQAVKIVGNERRYREMVNTSKAYFHLVEEDLEPKNLILVDTKFEKGRKVPERKTRFVDEKVTCDSSRLWDFDVWHSYMNGDRPNLPSAFDKEVFRKYLVDNDLKHIACGIPKEVAVMTAAVYATAYERITGEPFDGLRDRAMKNPIMTERIMDNIMEYLPN